MACRVLTRSLGFAAALGVLSVTQTARAQVRLYDLLNSRQNLRELDLTDAQKKRIEDLRKQSNLRKTEMRKAINDVEKDTQERVMAVLTRRQVERLSQLYYQNQGPRALQDPMTHKELGLTPAQIQQIETIRKAAQEAYRKPGRENWWKIVKDRDQKYLTVLTKAQRARWEKILGPPRRKPPTLTAQQQRALWSALRSLSPLNDRRYAEELKLTDRQKEKIRELSGQLWMNDSDLEEIRERYGERYARASGESSKAKIRQEMADAIAKHYERRRKAIFAVLTRQQRERLSQLTQRLSQRRYQSRGTAALPSADIADKLGLTKAQLEKLNALRDASSQAQQREQKESQERLKKIREQRDRNYLDVLTPEQRANWQKMLGRPLKRPDV